MMIEKEKDKLKGKGENWAAITLILIPMISVYASYIYGKIKPEYGGGAPIPVTLHVVTLGNENSAGTINTSLVDETEHGFYAVNSGEHKAFYLPRSTVTKIEFIGNKATIKKSSAEPQSKASTTEEDEPN